MKTLRCTYIAVVVSGVGIVDGSGVPRPLGVAPTLG